MTLGECLRDAIRPACTRLGLKFCSPKADALLLAIALQESGLETRKQTKGPARGFWQFERGGVQGVASHFTTREHYQRLLRACDVDPAMHPNRVQQLLGDDDRDVLAAGIARLNLWWLPNALPELGEIERAWEYYLAAWRPGKPHRHRWNTSYPTAMEAVLAHGGVE